MTPEDLITYLQLSAHLLFFGTMAAGFCVLLKGIR
jgi:hypothetical protein